MLSRMRRAFLGGAVLLFLALLCAVNSPVWALTVTVSVSDGGVPVVTPVTLSNPDPQDPDLYVGAAMSFGPSWNMDTPFVVAVENRHARLNLNVAFAFRNTSSVSKNYTVDFLMSGVDPMGGSKLWGGASLVGTATGGVQTVPATSFYSANVDGATYQTLLPAPISLGAAQQATNSFGRPDALGGNQPTPALMGDVDTSIGITWRVRMNSTSSSKKIASFNSDLIIRQETVPEPSSIVLFGIGVAGLGLACWRRAKRLNS